MKKYKITTNVSVVFLLFAGFIFSVSANSSWAWISEKRPYDLLPFVALATLIATLVFPVPGGPTRHSSPPLTSGVSCLTARYSMILSLTLSRP